MTNVDLTVGKQYDCKMALQTNSAYRASSNLDAVGSYRFIDSVDTGRFIPGQFRINPVTIKKGYGSATAGFLERLPPATCLYGTYFRTEGPFVGGNLGWYNSDPNLAAESLAKAKAKVQSAELDLAVMLGELGETLLMLKSPFSELAKVLASNWKLVSKTRNSKIFAPSGNQFGRRPSQNHWAHDTANLIAGNWLLYRYGIIPLISDIDSIMQAFEDKAKHVFSVLQRKRGTVTSVDTVSSTIYNQYLGNMNGQWDVLSKTTYTTKATSVVYFQRLLELQTLGRLRFAGLHPCQIPGAMWELVPFSFVVDWFVGVGNWLKAITPDASLTMLGYCTSVYAKCEYSREAINLRWYNGFPGLTRSSAAKYNSCTETLVRTVKTGSDWYVPPVLNVNRYKFKQICDSLALFWAIILGPRIRGKTK
jgi:hypothetical protein